MSARDFIDQMVDDLSPVRPAPSWARTVPLWIALSALIAAGAVLALGPMRSGVVDELLHFPRLALEIGLGLATIVALVSGGLEIGVPGAPSKAKLLLPVTVLALAWLLLSFGVPFGFEALTAPPPSMVGKREHCFIESLLVSIPPYAVALALLRRRSLYVRALSGLLVGAAAAGLPAVLMQLACMYEPGHAMRFHFTPILLVAFCGAILSTRLLPRP